MSSFVNLLDIIYPVDSIYITNSTISPASTIGGSWTQISGAVCGNADNNGLNYGSDSHTLTVYEMPSHNHPCSVETTGWGGVDSSVSDVYGIGKYTSGRTNWLTNQFVSHAYTGGGRVILLSNTVMAVMFGEELPKVGVAV